MAGQSYDTSVAVVLAVLAVISFIQLVGYSIFEYITKLARPQSTVNFNKMTSILVGATAGVFLLCVSDAAEFIIPDEGFSPFIHLIGYCLFQALFCYFLILAGYPLLSKDTLHAIVQDTAAVASIASGLQFFAVIAAAMYADVANDILQYVYIITQIFVIIATSAYMALFIRRFYRKLRNPRGNEEELSARGLYCAILAIFGLGISLIAVSVTDGRSLAYLFSRLVLTALVGTMIYMKSTYDEGLTKNIGGKYVYIPGYSVSDTDEIEALTAMEKPRIGMGAVA
ncbi:hypothetical protein MP638_005141 [Amoeboaphelidium occidentale]|nr:hypothetical protein MP638_005141 [Amoeboaphelidium occidentale]